MIASVPPSPLGADDPLSGAVSRRAAGWSALSGGLSHILFAASSFGFSGLTARLQTPDYPASLVLDYRAAGVAQGLLVFVWGAALVAAVLGLGPLAFREAGQFSGRLATALGVIGGGIVVLSSGVAIAMYSGATADISASGADIATQQAVLQAAWVINHACWYIAFVSLSAWLLLFALGARRTGVFGALGVVLSILVVIAVLASVIALPYPTVGVPVSLYLLILGVVLLVRARRQERSV